MDANELALWRFSLIAPLLHRAPGVSLNEMARQLAAETKQSPEGQPILVSVATLLRWLRRYHSGRLEALKNQLRCDRGRSRALDATTIATLLDLLGEHADWTVKAIHRYAQAQLGRSLPLKSVYRLLHGHRREQQPKELRRRPVGVPQVLWLADTMHGVWVYGPHGRKQKCYLIVILDDASRAVMAGRFVLHDDVAALIPILREAILARGLPHRLLVDNGPNYRSRVLRTACAQLAIHLIYATPYHPTSKARLERFFLTVRLQMIPQLPTLPTLEQVKTQWARFLVEYHAAPHGPLSQFTSKPTSPLDFYLQFLPDVRHVPELALENLFLIEETRRVNPDCTFRLALKFFEVNAALVGSYVLVRFNPDNLNQVLYRPANDPKAAFQRAFPVQ